MSPDARGIAVGIAILAVFGVLFPLLTLGAFYFEPPQVVECIEDQTPAMRVEVQTHRAGHVVERDAFGCTFYWYEGPPFR